MENIWMTIWLLFTINIKAASSHVTTDLITLPDPVSLECDVSRKTNKLTDRIIDPFDFAIYEVPCVRQSKPIIILIEESNRLGAVTIHAGYTEESTSILDYFHVKLFRHDRSQEVCGWWTTIFQGPNNSMRVNCKLLNEPFRSVAILPTARTVQKMAANVRLIQKIPISEVEVVTKEYSTAVGFYGCYEFFNGEPSKYSGQCRDVCYDEAHIFASFRADSCICGSKIPTNIQPTENCFPECKSQPGFLCGGPTAFAVYIAKAPHIFSLGCFEFRPPDDSMPDGNLTPVACIKKCSKEDKLFAFVSQGEYCVCEDDEPSGETEPEDCDFNCSGDPLMNCGGEKSALVYSGCLSERKISCLDIYKCQDEDIDEFGHCMSSCEEGWLLPYCLSRELPIFTTTSLTTTSESTTTTEAPIVLSTATEKPMPVVTQAATTERKRTTVGTTPTPERVEPHDGEGGGGVVFVILLLGVVAAAGASIWFFKIKNAGQSPVAPSEGSSESTPEPQAAEANE